MILQPIQYLFWGISFLSYVLLAAVMLHKGSFRRYPNLFSLAIFEIALAVILFNLTGRPHYRQYFYVYWIGAALRALIGFGIMYDIVRGIPGTQYIPKSLWKIFVRASLIITILLVWMSFERCHDTSRITGLVIGMNRGLYIAWGAIAICMFIQMGFIGIGWTPTPLRIAIGFLVNTLISLVSAYGISIWPHAGVRIDQAAQLLLVAVWAYWATTMGIERTDPDTNSSPELLDTARAILRKNPNRL